MLMHKEIFIYIHLMCVYFFMRITRDYFVLDYKSPDYNSIMKLFSIIGSICFSIIPYIIHKFIKPKTYKSFFIIIINLFLSLCILSILLLTYKITRQYGVIIYYSLCDIFVSFILSNFWKLFNSCNFPKDRYNLIFRMAQFGVAFGAIMALCIIYLKLNPIFFLLPVIFFISFLSNKLQSHKIENIENNIQVSHKYNFTLFIVVMCTVLTGILGGVINAFCKSIVFVYLNKDKWKFILYLILLWIVQSIITNIIMYFYNKIYKIWYGPLILLIYSILLFFFWGPILMSTLVIIFKIIKSVIMGPYKEHFISQQINSHTILNFEGIFSRVGKFLSASILSYFVIFYGNVNASPIPIICISILLFIITLILHKINVKNHI